MNATDYIHQENSVMPQRLYIDEGLVVEMMPSIDREGIYALVTGEGVVFKRAVQIDGVVTIPGEETVSAIIGRVIQVVVDL